MVQELADKHASDAILNRMWWHSVGLVNANRVVGTLPDGTRGDEEVVGMGAAVMWRGHNVILTAEHVVKTARPGDLRIFCRPSGNMEIGTNVEQLRKGVVEAYDATILGTFSVKHCSWEDLAAIIVPHDFGKKLNVEFFELSGACANVESGGTLSCFGFPADSAFVLAQMQERGVKKVVRGLSPSYWQGDIMSTKDSHRFLKDFDSDQHFLIHFEPAKDGKHPGGYSGGAMWGLARNASAIWHPKLLFAGICTHFYPKRDAEKVIKPSTVVTFLKEAIAT